MNPRKILFTDMYCAMSEAPTKRTPDAERIHGAKA